MRGSSFFKIPDKTDKRVNNTVYKIEFNTDPEPGIEVGWYLEKPGDDRWMVDVSIVLGSDGGFSFLADASHGVYRGCGRAAQINLLPKPNTDAHLVGENVLRTYGQTSFSGSGSSSATYTITGSAPLTNLPVPMRAREVQLFGGLNINLCELRWADAGLGLLGRVTYPVAATGYTGLVPGEASYFSVNSVQPQVVTIVFQLAL